MFAVRAFKHAIFGTPAPPQNDTVKKSERKVKLDLANAKELEMPLKKTEPIASPSKPNGILLTPGTSRGRKTVTFGEHVVDNEGKKGGQINRSGIPNDCPGKFPSPFTPGAGLQPDTNSEKRPRTKLTEQLYEARSTAQSNSSKIGKAKDDLDLTLNMSEPRSESGHYWKEQYESYAAKSEKEMKKLVAKQQLAKSYAKKKDAEAMETTARLQEERKRFKLREKELEAQNKDYQERLRVALAENNRAAMELAALKKRVADLEGSGCVAAEVQSSKSSTFQIFEDESDPIPLHSDPNKSTGKSTESRINGATHSGFVIPGKPVQPAADPPSEKHSWSFRGRHSRRSTLPDGDALTRPNLSRSGTESAVGSYPTKSPLALFEEQHRTPIEAKAALAKDAEHLTSFSVSKPSFPVRSAPVKENIPPTPLSNTTPAPTKDKRSDASDLWLPESSPFPEMNRMAFPLSTAPSYNSNQRMSKVKYAGSNTAKPATSTTVRGDAKHVSTDNENKQFTSTTRNRDQKLEGALSFVEGRSKMDIPQDRREAARQRLAQKQKGRRLMKER